MRVKDVKTEAVFEVNDGYGARLIEQGKAISVPAERNANAKTKRKAEDVKQDGAQGQN